MNNKLRKTAAMIVIAASLTGNGYSVLAADAPGTEVQAPDAVSYQLTDLLDVEIKSVVNERVAEGTRLGVVIRIKNKGGSITRVPDYELRVKTNDGIEYTLQPSAMNVKAIQPRANTELSYMAVVDRTDDVTLSEVNWTDVDYYVYPKKETLVVAAPITVQVWKGSDKPISDPTAVKKWADSFVIPSLISPIQYTPVGINKESTADGTVYVVQFLAYNPTNGRETIPDFVVDGKTEGKVFSGKRVEQGDLVLEAKEEKYVHFAISTDQETELKSLNLLTPEKFAQAGASGGAAGSLVNYNVGRLNILLPSQQNGSQFEAYTLGQKMKFDQRSELIHPGFDISIVEFNMDENQEEGDKNVTAKFKITNTTDRPLSVPVFQSDLVSSDGYEYSGSRQNINTPSVLPNSSLTVSYSYKVPMSETGKGLAVKVQDAKTAAPYKTTVAAYRLELQSSSSNDAFTVYPFDVKLTSWSVGYIFNSMGPLSYTYKGKFSFNIERQEQVQVDQNFSRLQFELYDSAHRLIGTSTGSFLGANRLTSGENLITFNGSTDKFEMPLYVKIYEVFTTANGESKRLLTELKQ